MTPSSEFILFFALVAAFFFYGVSQSRSQLTFLLVATWLALLFMSRLSPWLIENNMFLRANDAYAATLGSAVFLLFIFLFHLFFRRVFGRGHVETAAWWQVVSIAFLEAGLVSAGIFALFDFSSYGTLSPSAYQFIGSPLAFIVWLLLPFFGIVLLAKKRPARP